MRRHNKKGNGFYKIAKATPKYVSIDAVLVKVAQDYLRKIAEASDAGASGPSIPNSTGSTEGTTTSLPTGTDAGPKTQTEPQTIIPGPSAPQSGGEPSGSGESPAAATLPSGQLGEQPLGNVAQGTAPQSADVSPAPGDTASSQPGAIGTEKTEVTSGPKEKTDVVEAPARKEPPNYLKNLALLIGIPLTIASLAGGAIRGFGMSNLIGLGLGAAATMYGVGFLDSVLHPKAMLHEEIENLKRREAGKYLSDTQRAMSTATKVYGYNRTLLGIPRDYYSTEPPEAFKTIYDAAHQYIMGLQDQISELRSSSHKIFGYEHTGVAPDQDMLNSLEEGKDLERHATIIVLANLLKRIENDSNGGRDKAADVLKRLMEKTQWWYVGWWNPFGRTRPYLADPRTLMILLEETRDLDFPGKRDAIYSIKTKRLSQHLVEAAQNFGSGDTEEKAQAR